MSKTETNEETWENYVKNKKQYFHDEAIRLKTMGQTTYAQYYLRNSRRTSVVGLVHIVP